MLKTLTVAGSLLVAGLAFGTSAASAAPAMGAGVAGQSMIDTVQYGYGYYGPRRHYGYGPRFYGPRRFYGRPYYRGRYGYGPGRGYGYGRRWDRF